MNLILLYRFMVIHFFSLNKNNRKHIADLLLLTKQKVNINEKYIIINQVEVTIDDLTAHCFGLLLPLISKKEDRIFLSS